MTGATLRYELDDRAAQAALGRLIDAGTDLTPAMDEIGSALVASVIDRFSAGEDPDGNPWTPSRRASEEGGRTLVDTARLMQSITHAAGSDYVDVGTNVIYAAIHQLGGTIHAKTDRGLVFPIGDGSFRRVQEVTIPARPFLGLSDADADEIVEILRDHLSDAIGAGAAP